MLKLRTASPHLGHRERELDIGGGRKGGGYTEALGRHVVREVAVQQRLNCSSDSQRCCGDFWGQPEGGCVHVLGAVSVQLCRCAARTTGLTALEHKQYASVPEAAREVGDVHRVGTSHHCDPREEAVAVLLPRSGFG